MIKVVNPFNKNMEEVYSAANYCACACSVGEHATNLGITSNIGYANERTYCTCGYNNQAANEAIAH